MRVATRALKGSQTILVWRVERHNMVQSERSRTRAGSSGYLRGGGAREIFVIESNRNAGLRSIAWRSENKKGGNEDGNGKTMLFRVVCDTGFDIDGVCAIRGQRRRHSHRHVHRSDVGGEDRRRRRSGRDQHLHLAGGSGVLRKPRSGEPLGLAPAGQGRAAVDRRL